MSLNSCATFVELLLIFLFLEHDFLVSLVLDFLNSLQKLRERLPVIHDRRYSILEELLPVLQPLFLLVVILLVLI